MNRAVIYVLIFCNKIFSWLCQESCVRWVVGSPVLKMLSDKIFVDQQRYQSHGSLCSGSQSRQVDLFASYSEVPMERGMEVSRGWRAKGDAFNNQKNCKLGRTPLMSPSSSPKLGQASFFFVSVPSLWTFSHHQSTLYPASYELTLPLSGRAFPASPFMRCYLSKPLFLLQKKL